MSDMYGLKVIETQPKERKIILKVLVFYYDIGYSHQPIPTDPSFFCRALWSQGNFRGKKNGSIGHEVSTDQMLDEKWVDLNTYKFIKNVEQLTTANFPLDNYSAIEKAYDNGGLWAHEDKLVQATYEIEVTDAKYFDHLESGMQWETAFYETQAWQISHTHLNHLPDIANPIIQLNPFKENIQEAGTIDDVLFSEDNTYFFVLSSSGEIVCYQTADWSIFWRKDTQKWFGRLECNQTKKLLWIQDNSKQEKAIFNFSGEVVEEKIWPKSDKSWNKIYRAPSGNYFLDTNYGEKLIVYDAQGNPLWKYQNENKGEHFTAFFNKKEQLLVSEIPPNRFKIFDLKTGSVLSTLETPSEGHRLNIDPTEQFFSFKDRKSTKIVEIASDQTIFEYGTRYYNGDFLGQFIWSPNNKMGAIITTGEGERRNNGYGGYVTIYPIGIDSLTNNE